MKKYIKIIGITLLLLCLPVGASVMAFMEIPEGLIKADSVKIALVNEDIGAIFGEEKIILGKTFANDLENDASYDIYTVSRGVAEKGLETEIYDMMLLLPRDFSEKAIALDEENPDFTNIYYKIAPTKSYLFQRDGENLIASIEKSMQDKLVKMYFMSVLKNLQGAQENTVEIIAKEVKHGETIETTTQKEMKNLADSLQVNDRGINLLGSGIEGSYGSSEGINKMLESHVKSNETSSDYLSASLNDLDSGWQEHNQKLISFGERQVVIRGDITGVLVGREEDLTGKKDLLREELNKQKNELENKRVEVSDFEDPIDLLFRENEATIKEAIESELDSYDLQTKERLNGQIKSAIGSEATSSNILAYINHLISTGGNPTLPVPTEEPVQGEVSYFIPPETEEVIITPLNIGEFSQVYVQTGNEAPVAVTGTMAIPMNTDIEGDILTLFVKSVYCYSNTLPDVFSFHLSVDETVLDNQNIQVTYFDGVNGMTSGASSYLGDTPINLLSKNSVDLSYLASSGSLYHYIENLSEEDSFKEDLVGVIYDVFKQVMLGPSTDIQKFKEDYIGQINYQIGEIDKRLSRLSEIEESINHMAADRDFITEKLQELEEDNTLILGESQRAYSENFGMEGVSFKLKEESASLLSASQSYFEMSTGNMEQLNTLNEEGVKVKESSADLIVEGDQVIQSMETIVTKWKETTDSHNTYAENFSDVFSNAKVGSMDNDQVYSFLSSPIASNAQGDNTYLEQTIYPYFLMIIIMMCSFFTAYIFERRQVKKWNKDEFSEEGNGWNPILKHIGWLEGAGLIEGLIIGGVSSLGTGLKGSYLLMWLLGVVLLVEVFVLVFYLLLKYLRTSGLFIGIAAFIFYLLVNNFLAFNAAKKGMLEFLTGISPFIYMETILKGILFKMPSATWGPLLMLGMLFIGLTVLGIALEKREYRRRLHG